MRTTLATALILALALAVPVSADEDWDAGVAAYKAGNFDQAAAAFALYVEKVEDAYQGHQMLGVALLKAGEARKAATHLQRANELNPDTWAIQLPLGQALLASGQGRDACAVLGGINESSLPSANRTTLYQLRAKASCGGGIGDLRKIAQAKNTGETWAAYGVAALNEGELSEAITALDKAVGLEPNEPRIRKSHVSALVRQARSVQGRQKEALYDKAVDSAKRYAELQSGFNSQLTYGEVLLGAKDYSQAVAALKKASQLKPGEWLPDFYLGQAYTALEDYDAAEAPLRQALSKTSRDADQRMINRQLGFTYEKQKNYGQAITYYQRAGDQASVARVRENERIAEENEEAEEFNKKRQELLEEQRRLREEMESVPTGGPPPRN